MKIDGLRLISQLSSQNGDVLQSDMHNIVLAVLGEIRNLRSQVCRQAIQTVGQLFQHCGKAMEQVSHSHLSRHIEYRCWFSKIGTCVNVFCSLDVKCVY